MRISELKVAARTSAFSFKGKDMEVGDIARKLNVGAILEGSVRKSGEQVRINVQLVNAVNGYHLWSQTYDRELDDIFEVQADIAANVVRQLQATLLGNPASPGHTPSTEAYTAYLQGNYFCGRLNRDKAIAYYEQALQLDEHYAAAMVGLARARFGFAFGVRPDTDVAEARAADRPGACARSAAGRGVSLPGRTLRESYDFDWAAAEVSLKRARELEPSNADVLRGAAFLAETLGRFDESVALFRQALERDPLNTESHSNLGRVLLGYRETSGRGSEFSQVSGAHSRGSLRALHDRADASSSERAREGARRSTTRTRSHASAAGAGGGLSRLAPQNGIRRGAA